MPVKQSELLGSGPLGSLFDVDDQQRAMFVQTVDDGLQVCNELLMTFYWR